MMLEAIQKIVYYSNMVKLSHEIFLEYVIGDIDPTFSEKIFGFQFPLFELDSLDFGHFEGSF